jgi:hypothetical protein
LNTFNHRRSLEEELFSGGVRQPFAQAARAQYVAQLIQLDLFAYIEEKQAYGRTAKSGTRCGVHEAISLTRCWLRSLTVDRLLVGREISQIPHREVFISRTIIAQRRRCRPRSDNAVHVELAIQQNIKLV